MMFDSPIPEVLEWRHRPWPAWIAAAVLAGTAVVFAAGFPFRWEVECRRGPPARPDAAVDAEANCCRVGWGALLWTHVTTVPLSEIEGVDGQHSVGEDDSGRKRDSYRLVLRTTRGDVPAGAWSRDAGQVSKQELLLGEFLRSRDAGELRFEPDPFVYFLWVVVILSLAAAVPLVLFPRSASCVLDRRTDTVTVVRGRFFGSHRIVRPLGEIRGFGIFEAYPDKGRNRHRLCAMMADGDRLVLARRPRRMDVLEPPLRELRKFLGFDAEEEPVPRGRPGPEA